MLTFLSDIVNCSEWFFFFDFPRTAIFHCHRHLEKLGSASNSNKRLLHYFFFRIANMFLMVLRITIQRKMYSSFKAKCRALKLHSSGKLNSMKSKEHFFLRRKKAFFNMFSIPSDINLFKPNEIRKVFKMFIFFNENLIFVFVEFKVD